MTNKILTKQQAQAVNSFDVPCCVICEEDATVETTDAFYCHEHDPFYQTENIDTDAEKTLDIYDSAPDELDECANCGEAISDCKCRKF